MEISTDPYEQKLYQLFKSYEGQDSGIDRTDLLKLCTNLELKERGDALVNLLGMNNKQRVDFQEFRAALLQILGEEISNKERTTTSMDHTPSPSSNNNNKGQHITQINIVAANESDENLSDREVKPKFVVGTKKYGRRSRPVSSDDILSDEDDDHDDDSDENSSSTNNKKDETYYMASGNSPAHDHLTSSRNKVQRSASQSDIHGTKRKRPMSASRLKRCASLPPQRSNIPRRIPKDKLSASVTGGEIEGFSLNLAQTWNSIQAGDAITLSQLQTVCEKLGLHKLDAEQAAKEAFEKLGLNPNSSLIPYHGFLNLIQTDAHVLSRENSVSKLNITNPDHISVDNLFLAKETGAVSVEIIIDMWEAAGVASASALLVGLGFYGNEIQISELILVLEEEIQRCSNEKEVAPFLKAALTLHKAEVGALRQAFRQLVDENKKLYSNNKEMNKRAALLAQEVDERHSTIEKSTKNEIKQLEQRHNEAIKELSQQIAQEREQYTAINARLEERVKNVESEENKLRAELSSMLEENSALENEKCDLQSQIADLYEQNIKLNREVAELEELRANEFKDEKTNEEVLELIDKVSALQIENANLRDKTDELNAEIEGLSMEIARLKARKPFRSATTSDSILNSTENNTEESLGTIEQEINGSAGTKRRGDSPSKTRICEESPRLGKLRKCNDGNESGPASGDWVPLNSEINQSITATITTSGFSQDSSISEAEFKALKDKVAELQKELQKYKSTPLTDEALRADYEKVKIRCDELEESLEQMRKAYEDCEDYWQGKLAEERQLYEEEQRQNDDKLNELLRKMSEYEEQFASRDGKLSPIEENSMLEQQYIALEAEMEDLTRKAKAALEERDNEIDAIKAKLKQIQRNTATTPPRVDTPDSPASSTISYLFWNQSSIHGPARDYQNPVYGSHQWQQAQGQMNLQGLSYKEEEERHLKKSISPIQRPTSKLDDGVDAKSVASTHSVHYSTRPNSTSTDPSPVDEADIELKEKNLRDEISILAHKRDCLVVELQQLQGAKPILEKAYARTPHPNLTNRIQFLEQKNKQLTNALKQQQQYMESVMHQAWQQQRMEIVELRNRLEAQSVVIAEQAQRLANADLLAKDLFLENSHLTASIQRLEQQRTRQTLMQLSQHLPHMQQQAGLSSMNPGH